VRGLTRARAGRGDRGAVLLLVALILTTLVVIVALVVDLSFVRNTRQSSKATTDAVAAAGLQSLAPDAVPKPWRGACAALDYVRANEPGRTFTIEYLDGNGDPVAGSPCTTLVEQACEPGALGTWAWIRATDGDHVVDIRSGYVTPDPAFPEDAGAHALDDGDPAWGGCDQIAVIVGHRDAAYFGGIAGASGYETALRTVGRVDVASIDEGVPAFLMLERTRCTVLSHSVGTGGGLGIIVEPASTTEPGLIHVDSSASQACTNNDNEGGFAVYGTPIGGVPGIQAQPAGSTPGILSLRALAMGNASNAWATVAGVSPAGTPGGLVSRMPVDLKYNPPSGATISQLLASARVDAVRTSAPAGYTTVSTCNKHVTTAAEQAATRVFIDCPGGYSPDAATFTAAQDVIVNGPVQVSNKSSLYFPSAQRIVVGGTSARGLEVSNGGLLGVNSEAPFTDDSDAAVRASCSTREGPAWPRTSNLIVFGGSSSGAGEGGLNVGGRAALCQTFVLLGGPKTSSHAIPQQVTDGTGDATCVAATPCPTGSSAATDASLMVTGFLRWSAPNQLSTQPPAGAAGVEDLALWAETSKMSEVKSGGVLEARGVYFLPNSRVELRSPAVALPQDAQFIARSLKLFAGTLRMKPTPENNVQVNVLVGVSLVR
jgi:hypothetical protein